MPTVREICSETGISSASVVHKILASLEERGYIKRYSNSSRSIVIENYKNSVNIPILGKVTAGIPILATEQIEQYFNLEYLIRYYLTEQLFGLIDNLG
jgi:repressor LexA